MVRVFSVLLAFCAPTRHRRKLVTHGRHRGEQLRPRQCRGSFVVGRRHLLLAREQEQRVQLRVEHAARLLNSALTSYAHLLEAAPQDAHALPGKAG